MRTAITRSGRGRKGTDEPRGGAFPRDNRRRLTITAQIVAELILKKGRIDKAHLDRMLQVERRTVQQCAHPLRRQAPVRSECPDHVRIEIVEEPVQVLAVLRRHVAARQRVTGCLVRRDSDHLKAEARAGKRIAQKGGGEVEAQGVELARWQCNDSVAGGGSEIAGQTDLVEISDGLQAPPLGARKDGPQRLRAGQPEGLLPQVEHDAPHARIGGERIHPAV